MLVKTICAKSKEGKTTELFSEISISKRPIFIISDELSIKAIQRKIYTSNFDISKIFVGHKIDDELIKVENVKTVLLDMNNRDADVNSILKKLNSLNVRKVVYTQQLNNIKTN